MREKFTSIFRRYTSYSGRLGRLQFLIMSIRLYIIEELLLIASIFASNLADTLAMILYFITYCLVLWANTAVAVRRMHDLNLSGWWLLIIMPVVLVTLAESDINTEGLQMIFATTVIILIIIFLIVLYFKKGSVEENKYGPPPV